MLARLRRFADGAVAGAAVIVTLALLAIVVSEAILRNLDRSLAWSQEVAQYLLVWLAFLGWIVASRRRSHIRITVLMDRLPRPLRRAAEIAIQLGIMVLAGILVWQGYVLIARNLDVLSSSLPIPNAVLYGLVPVLGLALLVQAVVEISEAVTGRPAPRPPRDGPAT